MQTFKIKDEYIKLGQALKAAGLAESGVDAKYAVQDGLVKVNGQVETQRGKNWFPGILWNLTDRLLKSSNFSAAVHDVIRYGLLQF